MAEGGACPDPLLADSDGDTLVDGDEVVMGTNACAADTDSDGVPDAEDPTPTDPGVPVDFIEEGLRDLGATVDGLDLGQFEGRNDNARSGRRNALSNRLNSAANAAREGDYQEAIDQLESILLRIDGDPTPPDWMKDPQRVLVRVDIELWRDLLLLLLP